MDILFVAGSAFLGGIASGVMGWLDSGEPFVARKFTSSVIRALAAGVVFAVGYTLSGESISILDICIAFVSGSGIDVLGNRLAGSIRG